MEESLDGQLLMDQDGVSLSTAIALLRSELQDAIDAGERSRLRFSAESIELELEVTIKATRKADGKVSLWQVASAGGSRDSENAAKHRLKLVLTPKDMALPSAAKTLIGDKK